MAGQKRAAQSEKTKKTLFEAATQLFRDKGFYATSIEDIVSAAGTSVGAFYYHFKCKEDLVYLWADVLDENYQEYYDKITREPDHGNAMDIARKMFCMSLESYSRWGSEFSAVSYSYMMRTPELNNRMVNGFRVFFRIISELFRQGQEEGSIRRDIPVEVLVHNYTKAIRGAIIDWCISGGGDAIVEQNIPFINAFLDGMRPQP